MLAVLASWTVTGYGATQHDAEQDAYAKAAALVGEYLQKNHPEVAWTPTGQDLASMGRRNASYAGMYREQRSGNHVTIETSEIKLEFDSRPRVEELPRTGKVYALELQV